MNTPVIDLGVAPHLVDYRAAVDFMERAVQADEPFFVWYAPFLPHTPHNPPERLLRKYRDQGLSDPVAKYYAMCEWFDETCGRLLGHLDEQGVAGNTLVVYVTDNGWIQRPDRNGYAPRSKRSPYEGGVRTPIMFRWPGTIPAADRPELCSSIDIVPTILAAAGAAVDRIAGRLQRGEIPVVGRTEAELSAELGRQILDEGHHRVNFAIVAAGANAASPHHEAGDRVIGPGDIVLCDFGGTMVDDLGVGYCSDITRCVHLGPPPAEIAEAYDVLHEAQQASVRAATVGRPAEEVDAAGRSIIVAAGEIPDDWEQLPDAPSRRIAGLGRADGRQLHAAEPAGIAAAVEALEVDYSREDWYLLLEARNGESVP